MVWRVDILPKPGVFDPVASSILKDIHDLGIPTVKHVDVVKVFHIEGDLKENQIEQISQTLLVDPITQEYQFSRGHGLPPKTKLSKRTSIEIAFHPGVMDPVEESTIKGIRDLGFTAVKAVRTSKRYNFSGELDQNQQDMIVSKILANKLIQHVVDPTKPVETLLFASAKKEIKVLSVDLLNASDKELVEINRKGQLFLSLAEMKTIKAHFKKQGRNPTDAELETIAQTWSEHCYHKTFRGNIRFKEGKKTRLIKSLFKSTIVKATSALKKPWCVSVFHDNAGIIKFDDKHHVCFKVETHNHPSALEPFGGANTGIGGVIRDILGTGLGAKPICSTDVFCFAPPDLANSEVPAGTLHPKRVMKGVVNGVRDYGNKMGIPTVNGAICFDPAFVSNPLVYCGNVGLIPKDKVLKKVRKGDLIVAVGGKTGRDGIHGATFSSGELTDESEVVSSGAVQIGNPIEEKKVLDGLMKARDEGLYTAITDCGAGGFSSAVGEMGKDLGAKVYLDKAPLKYQGLSYAEIWISESQERMVLSVPSKSLTRLQEIFKLENVEAVVIGEFIDSGRLELFYENIQVADLDMHFLHEGIPLGVKEAEWKAPSVKKVSLPKSIDLQQKLLDCLSDYNVCSKEWVIRQYDHEVQGASVIKPLVGVNCDGPSDASIVAPKPDSLKGIAISNGVNPNFGKLDPFWMAASCIDEAIRQIVCVGGNPEKIAILDNFCWGNPDKPDRLGSLVKAAEGCYEAAIGYGTPFISGKDSLYNEYTQNGQSLAIPGTLLISAIGVVDNVTKAVTMDLKEKGNLLYLVGNTSDELGGSVYLKTFDILGGSVPRADFRKASKAFAALYQAMQKGLVRSAHDCSEGGLGVALAEMAFAGGLGATVMLNKVPFSGGNKRDDVVLFSESNSRLIIEVAPKNQKAFENALKGIIYGQIGVVEKSSVLTIFGLKGEPVVSADINQLKETWQAPLRW